MERIILYWVIIEYSVMYSVVFTVLDLYICIWVYINYMGMGYMYVYLIGVF